MHHVQRAVIGLLCAALVQGCSKAPTTADVSTALSLEYGQTVRVEAVERVNGVKYPGGSGAPEGYGIEFNAKLAAAGPVTFRISANLQRAMEKCPLVKGIAVGHQADAEGLAALAGIGTELWRTDETRPAWVSGVVRFVDTENGWRAAETRVCLAADSMAAASMPPRTFVGYWGTACYRLRVRPTRDPAAFTVKSWYCEADEPNVGITATLAEAGRELHGLDLVIKMLPGGTLSATFRDMSQSDRPLVKDEAPFERWASR